MENSFLKIKFEFVKKWNNNKHNNHLFNKLKWNCLSHYVKLKMQMFQISPEPRTFWLTINTTFVILQWVPQLELIHCLHPMSHNHSSIPNTPTRPHTLQQSQEHDARQMNTPSHRKLPVSAQQVSPSRPSSYNVERQSQRDEDPVVLIDTQ